MKKILSLIAIVATLTSCENLTSSELKSEDVTISTDSTTTMDTTSLGLDSMMTETK